MNNLFHRTRYLLGLTTALTLASVAAQAQSAQALGEQARPCLNYWQQGAANPCSGPEKPRKATRAVTPTAPVTAIATSPSQPVSPAGMEQKIDKFLADYGKPPREFVAFYLNPTPENAMKWVHTYQEILNRPQQLAYVWTQAETLYANALKQGAPAATYTSTTFVPVHDFGIAVPGFSSPISPSQAYMPSMPPPAASKTPNSLAGAAAALPGTLQGVTLGNLASQAGQGGATGGLDGFGNLGASATPSAFSNPLAGTNPLVATLPAATGGAAATTAGMLQNVNQSLDLTYYFSATCPYCRRFTPEMAQLMSGLTTVLPGHVKLTCVDLTPYMGPPEAGQPYIGPQESNIKGMLPACAWRTPAATEEDQLGITQTPTLLVRRGGPGAAPEKVSGYVAADRLRAYLLNGTPL